MRIAFLILVVLLIPFNTVICQYFYPCDDGVSVMSWWHLRMDIYSVMFAILFLFSQTKKSASIEAQRWCNFLLYIGAALTLSDVWDRWIMNSRVFTTEDILLCILFGVLGFKKNFPYTFGKVIKIK